MVDEPGQVAALGCIDDGIQVDSEQVAAPDAFLLVPSLSHISYDLRNEPQKHVKIMNVYILRLNQT